MDGAPEVSWRVEGKQIPSLRYGMEIQETTERKCRVLRNSNAGRTPCGASFSFAEKVLLMVRTNLVGFVVLVVFVVRW